MIGIISPKRILFRFLGISKGACQSERLLTSLNWREAAPQLVGLIDGPRVNQPTIVGRPYITIGAGSAEAKSIVSDRRVIRQPPASQITGRIRNLSLIHISEPTRQAEISYAVFCLKKKKNKKKKHQT